MTDVKGNITFIYSYRSMIQPQILLDDLKCVLTMIYFTHQDWHDDRLKWNPQKYNNLTDIVVKPNRIWLPELALMNG